MKTYRSTYILLGLFFASLLALWGIERAGVLTETERRRREARVLPDLVDVAEVNVRKVAIERGPERMVFERRGAGPGRWQMVEPLGAAAEPTRLETLVRNLKDLRKSIDSGKITGPANAFGLAPPLATVKLWGQATGEDRESDQPIAVLAVGKSVRGTRYVRPAGSDGIEVADAKLLTAVDLPVADWRERNIMAVPTFQVASVTIKRAGQVIRAARDQRGRWGMTAPVNAPANPAKIESLIAALSSLRVVDGQKGFVADDVKDFTPFGLAAPGVTVELTTINPAEGPLVLAVGKPVPDRPDRVYVRQGDQDDVVIVDAKALAEVPASAGALRSQQVADIEPAAVTEIQVQTRSDAFSLKKGPTDWELTAPRQEKADAATVKSFLSQLDALQTTEFLKPDQVSGTELDPPLMTVKIWEGDRAQSRAAAAAGDPTLVLRIGKHDALRKTVYARLENDPLILALPDTIAEVLPRNRFAFRDLTVVSFNPADIRKLTVIRAGRTDVLEPSKGGEPNRWRLRQPVDAPADTRSVTQALAVLSNLRADQFIASPAADPKTFGLDHPLLEIAWESERPHWLKVGSHVPRSTGYYAMVDDEPVVFTLKLEALKPFEAEFRDHLVLSFPAAEAQRMVLRWGWPQRTVSFRRRVPSAPGQAEWVDEPGADATGLDQSRVAAIVKALAHLEAIRFAQFDGPIPAYSGLHRPRLTVEVLLGSTAPARVLKIGYDSNDGFVFAAQGTAGSGPVFLLPAIAWDALISSGERFAPLPANVFAPLP